MSKPSTKQLIERIEKSELLSAKYPARERYTHAQWAMMTDDERRKPSPLIGFGFVREFKELVDQLADPQHASAVPLLTELWRNCPFDYARSSVGNALRVIGTPEARGALLDLIEDSDAFSVFLAVRAIFDEKTTKAFDFCIDYFDDKRMAQPGGTAIPREILRMLAPSGFASEPIWTDERAPHWLRQDNRWIELCVSLRKHDELGMMARDVLRYADKESVEKTIEKVIEKEVPKKVNVSSERLGDLLARYKGGDYQQVWTKLKSFEAIDGDLLLEAHEVAAETMSRVAHNVDVVAAWLKQRGWKSLTGALRTKPEPEDYDFMRAIEDAIEDRIPLTLRSFWEVVGGVDFVWNYECGESTPDLGFYIEEMDPLFVESAAGASAQLEEFNYQREGIHPEIADPFEVSLSPDYLHKINVSGGAAYSVRLPFLGVDPKLLHYERDLSFLEYLRHCFHWGGFPRLERHQDSAIARQILSELKKGFVEF